MSAAMRLWFTPITRRANSIEAAGVPDQGRVGLYHVSMRRRSCEQRAAHAESRGGTGTGTERMRSHTSGIRTCFECRSVTTAAVESIRRIARSYQDVSDQARRSSDVFERAVRPDAPLTRTFVR